MVLVMADLVCLWVCLAVSRDFETAEHKDILNVSGWSNLSGRFQPPLYECQHQTELITSRETLAITLQPNVNVQTVLPLCFDTLYYRFCILHQV